MRTIAACLFSASVGLACSDSSAPSGEAPLTEGTSGSAGSVTTSTGTSGGSVESGGTESQGGAGSSVASCPADSPTTCPSSGGFTTPCGAGHCTDTSGKKIVQETTYDTCHPDRLPTMGVGHPVSSMKGKFLPTLHGNEGDDDQCKYHVMVAVDGTAKNQDVYFTLHATNLGDGSLVKDNDPTPALDLFLTASHMPMQTNVKSTMTSPGTFKVGPVRFDQCGEWTARFHFFNHCGQDFADSPYANIAFFMNVP